MTYLDTNVLLYATLTHVDTPSQQDKAISVLHTCIKNNTLILSNLNLLEYAFVMHKAKEEKGKIESALKLFGTFVKDESDGHSDILVKALDNSYSFKNSFDLNHVVFANAYRCKKLLTFDKGFKRFEEISMADIEIL